MKDHLQRINDKNEYPVTISFKKNLINHFYDIVTEKMTDAGCHYFAHNIIKNCEEPITQSYYESSGCRVKYWEDYWDCNPLDYDRYQIRKAVGNTCVRSSFQEIDDNAKEVKKEMCKMKDGFHFYIQHDNGILENFSFGWEKHDANQVSPQKIDKLCHVMTELKIGFFRLNTDMFATYPAVY